MCLTPVNKKQLNTHHRETVESAGELTDVVLLNFVDVAVNWWVAKEGQHGCFAIGQRHHMGGVPLQGIRRGQRWFTQGPGASRDVKDPQLIRHVGRLHLQLPTKHEDVILQERREALKFVFAWWDYVPINSFKRRSFPWVYKWAKQILGDSFHAYGEVKCKDDCIIINAPHNRLCVNRCCCFSSPHYSECLLFSVFEGSRWLPGTESVSDRICKGGRCWWEPHPMYWCQSYNCRKKNLIWETSTKQNITTKPMFLFIFLLFWYLYQQNIKAPFELQQFFLKSVFILRAENLAE